MKDKLIVAKALQEKIANNLGYAVSIDTAYGMWKCVIEVIRESIAQLRPINLRTLGVFSPKKISAHPYINPKGEECMSNDKITFKFLPSRKFLQELTAINKSENENSQ